MSSALQIVPVIYFSSLVCHFHLIQDFINIDWSRMIQNYKLKSVYLQHLKFGSVFLIANHTCKLLFSVIYSTYVADWFIICWDISLLS